MSAQSIILAESFFGFERFAWIYQDQLRAIRLRIEGDQQYSGQIHYGRITKVQSSMNGAFVELGGKKQGFLPFSLAKDIMPLKEGQYAILQVIRDAEDGKDLRVTANINLTGLYWVLYPMRPKLMKLSQKINSKDDQERIATLLEPWLENYGITARTAARSIDNERLSQEFAQLDRLWQGLNEQVKTLKKPKKLLDFAHPLIQLLLEDVENPAEVIIFNSDDYLNKTMEQLEDHFQFPEIELATSEQLEVFEDFDVEEDFWNLLEKKVPLDGGGDLIIEETSAAIMIDVNGGGAQTSSQVMEVNFKACHEIARQIRLRNLSGQILVDFISVNNKNHYQQLITRLRQILKYDSQKPDILGFTKLGIMEITRRKRGLSMSEYMLQQNKGHLPLRPAVQRSLMLKRLEKELAHNPQARFKLYGSPKQIRSIQPMIEQRMIQQIEYIEAGVEYHLETF